MNEHSDSAHLAHTVARAAHRQRFLAHVFARYLTIEEIDEGALAERLGCSEFGYYRLALCRTPATDQAFAEQIRQIAAFSGASPIVLAQIIRRVQAVESLQEAASNTDRATLLAAREREDLDNDKE
ncbi:MAG: hypothetical protein KatS3mg043_0333 [Rhodothermaceae bacterium]|nr:MAG: hypothetical protein KatS3mg043_0333 [Rhodothermaceae bacterium]